MGRGGGPSRQGLSRNKCAEFWGRGAWPARREKVEYGSYSADEQRCQAGWIGPKMVLFFLDEPLSNMEMDLAAPGTVEFTEKEALPGSQLQFATGDGHQFRSAHQG